MASWRNLSWSDPERFTADARRADDDRLREMHRWAMGKERSADAPGTGRNPKARRLFRSMARISADELERRGLSY